MPSMVVSTDSDSGSEQFTGKDLEHDRAILKEEKEREKLLKPGADDDDKSSVQHRDRRKTRRERKLKRQEKYVDVADKRDMLFMMDESGNSTSRSELLRNSVETEYGIELEPVCTGSPSFSLALT